MYEKITSENVMMFAIKHYDNPQCESEKEFHDDIKRFKYIKRLLRKYKETKTLKERLIIAENLRKKSLQETKGKGEDIMDVNRQAVEKIFNQYHVDILIHGHTHRPNIHELQINNKNVKRVVLGDWYTSSYLLKYKKEKIIIDKTNLINQKSS